MAFRRSGVRLPSGPHPQHLVSVKPSTGLAVQREFGAAYFAVSDMTTGLVTIQIGCCPSLDAMNTGHPGDRAHQPKLESPGVDPSALAHAPARRRRRVYALAKRAVEGDLGEGALENGELLVVQLREE